MEVASSENARSAWAAYWSCHKSAEIFSEHFRAYFTRSNIIENNWFITKWPTLKTGRHAPVKLLMLVTMVLYHQAQYPGQNSHRDDFKATYLEFSNGNGYLY